MLLLLLFSPETARESFLRVWELGSGLRSLRSHCGSSFFEYEKQKNNLPASGIARVGVVTVCRFDYFLLFNRGPLAAADLDFA